MEKFSDDANSICNHTASVLKHNDYDWHVTLSVILIAIHCIIIISILGCNTLVNYVILTYKNMHYPINFYVASLCSSDALVGMFSLPLYMFLEFFCPSNKQSYCIVLKMYRFMTDFTFMMSVYSMVAMAAERHRAVFLAFRQSYTVKQCAVRIFIIFVCALIYASFWSIWYPAEKHPEYYDIARICNFNLTSTNDRFFGKLVLVDFFVLYIIPLTFSATLYVRVIYKLYRETREWRCANERDGVNPNNQIHMSASRLSSVSWTALAQKKRAIKMCLCILVVFAVMWMPYHVCHIYYMVELKELNEERPDLEWFVFPVVNILYFSNSWINCIIFGFFSIKFKRNLRRCFHCLDSDWPTDDEPLQNAQNGLEMRTSLPMENHEITARGIMIRLKHLRFPLERYAKRPSDPRLQNGTTFPSNENVSYF